jgi:hypothetical protein
MACERDRDGPRTSRVKDWGRALLPGYLVALILWVGAWGAYAERASRVAEGLSAGMRVPHPWSVQSLSAALGATADLVSTAPGTHTPSAGRNALLWSIEAAWQPARAAVRTDRSGRPVHYVARIDSPAGPLDACHVIIGASGQNMTCYGPDYLAAESGWPLLLGGAFILTPAAGVLLALLGRALGPEARAHWALFTGPPSRYRQFTQE